MAQPNSPFSTDIRRFGDAAIAEAARLIGQELPVAVPTETVYGLAADATSDAAVARIFEAKGRPGFNPLIVHVLGLDEAGQLAELPDAARALGKAFWPGPLTMVLTRKRGSHVADAATAGLPSIALRSPSHRAMRALLHACRTPLAAPSANRSGGISPTSAPHVLKTLNGRIPLIIDDGPTEQGIESTIISLAGGRISLLRPGPIGFEELKAVAGLDAAPAPRRIEAPGQMESHYAPSKPLRLEAETARGGEWLIGFGTVRGDEDLSAAGDLEEAAARLFEALHRADAEAASGIAIAPIPHHGLGIAINDRLRRAAAPRFTKETS